MFFNFDHLLFETKMILKNNLFNLILIIYFLILSLVKKFGQLMTICKRNFLN